MNGLGGRVSRLSELWGTLTAGISTFTPGVLALSSALAALAGYGIGKLLDSLAYKLSLGEVDFSGLNRLNELTKELSEQHQFLGLKVAKNTELLKSLGFEGATAQRDFNDAVREGAVIYDQAAQKWRNLNQEQAAAARDEEERKNRLAEASKYVIAMNEAELKNFQATVHSEIELLTQQYDQGKITLENYYKERQQLEYEAATREVETLQATLQMLEQIPEKNREEIIKVKEEINQLIIKYADQELQTEQQKNEKILANFEKLKNREVEILTSTNEKKNAEDEAAEARGEISHEEALQRKLDRDKELQDEELKNADELMAKILENYTQDSDKYKEALATRTVLMNKFAADNIRAEQQITEEQQKEQQKRDQSRRQAQEQAQTDLQYINQHAREMDTAQIAEFQQLISDYYKQALISGKEYLDAYNTLIEAKTRALSRTLVDGIQAMLNAYNNAFNAMNNTLSAFKNNNDFSDVKAQFRSMTSALTQDYKSMQDELNRYQDSAWSKLWGSLQGRLNEMMKSVYLYGRNVTIMSLDQVRDWAQRVSDYVQRVQDLFAQLKDQLISWQDELDQLKGNEVAIVDRWYTEEVQKLKDKYGEDLKNTAEYQEALTLLQEIYAEKRKKAIEDEAAATQQAIEDINNALSGAAPPSKGSGGSSASSVDLTKTKVNPATDLLKAAQQAVNSTDWDGIGKSIGASVDSAITKINDAFQGAAKIMPGEIKVEKKVSLDSVLNFNVLPGSEAERYVNDVLWPLLMKKFQLTGINL